MTKQKTDEQLVLQYQLGDVTAFEHLYQRYKNKIYRYFYRQVNSSMIADELHQDVWLNIIKSSASFKHQASFKTWLFKVAHNKLVDYYRSKARQLEDNNYKYHDIRGEILETRAPVSSQPEVFLMEKQLAKTVISAVEALPDEQKEVFLLHEYSGLSLQAIAVITENSFETVKSRLRYAVKKLRQYLQIT